MLCADIDDVSTRLHERLLQLFGAAALLCVSVMIHACLLYPHVVAVLALTHSLSTSAASKTAAPQFSHANPALASSPTGDVETTNKEGSDEERKRSRPDDVSQTRRKGGGGRKKEFGTYVLQRCIQQVLLSVGMAACRHIIVT